MTNSLKLYHNPDSSKSWAALALLEENDIEFETIYYLDHPPNKEEIRTLAVKLGLNVKQLLRKNEATFEQFDLDDEELSEEIVLDIVSEHPILIERPILVRGDKAVIGRPPEAVLQFAQETTPWLKCPMC